MVGVGSSAVVVGVGSSGVRVGSSVVGEDIVGGACNDNGDSDIQSGGKAKGKSLG